MEKNKELAAWRIRGLANDVQITYLGDESVAIQVSGLFEQKKVVLVDPEMDTEIHNLITLKTIDPVKVIIWLIKKVEDLVPDRIDG